MQHVSDLHRKFALRPHHVWKYSRHVIQCATAENRPGKKDRKKKEKKKPQDEDIMACPIPYGGIGRAIKKLQKLVKTNMHKRNTAIRLTSRELLMTMAMMIP